MDDRLRDVKLQGRKKELLGSKKDFLSRGAWSAEEDEKLAHAIEIYGPRRWNTLAAKSGLKRGAKSCRLRWMNYLRPNIKRGNITDQEEDLIVRLHKLLGNRWSLIAGRLPGRTDNEIKNYWNSHLSKKVKQIDQNYQTKFMNSSSSSSSKQDHCKFMQHLPSETKRTEKTILKEQDTSKTSDDQLSELSNFDVDDFFDFSNESPSNLELVSMFVQLD